MIIFLEPLLFEQRSLLLPYQVSKLLYHGGADLSKVRFVRLGTSGGVGVPAGTVCVTSQAYDGELLPGHAHVACGIRERWPSVADAELSQEMMAAAEMMVVPDGTIFFWRQRGHVCWR